MGLAFFLAALERDPDFIKDLSMNRHDFAEADDGRGEVDEGEVAVVELLEADKKFAEPVEPNVGGFDSPRRQGSRNVAGSEP